MKILYALATEKAVGAAEKNNCLTFIVSDGTDKTALKKEIEESYGEKVARINTLRAFDGRKKAVVRFARKGAASDLAGKLKLI
jgi:ribosomal protein L23